jgi:hypothetical protein
MYGELFVFFQEWVLPQIIIEVAQKMSPTFLLSALHAVIAAIEIGNQHAIVSLKDILNHRCLPCWRKPVNNVPSIREYENVLVCAANVDFGLIDVSERAVEDGRE